MIDGLVFAVNARFLTRPASGVDRVAIELIVALVERPEVDQLILLHPPAHTIYDEWLTSLGQSAREKIVIVAKGKLTGHLWEQTELVCAFPDLMLLSLCSTGPILRRNHTVMIHDAQVWDAPESYSLSFRIVYRILLPIVARTARKVLTVSQFAKGRLEALGIVPRGKTHVILNGADHMDRISADPGTLSRHSLTKKRYILAIGNLAPHKNLAMLVKAAVARSPGAPELIVAGGVNSNVFAEAGLSFGNGVRFVGRISDAELKALYEGALALAFPSLTEGFGLPPVEAMICGCAVLATTGGAVPEVCGEAAYYVDPNNLSDWTNALEEIALSSELRVNLSAWGLQRIGFFTWARAAESLSTVILGR